MGGQLPIQVVDIEITDVIDSVVQELRAGHPEQTSGDTKLHADPTRVAQAVSNLILNALQHGDQQQPADVYADGQPDNCRLHSTMPESPSPPIGCPSCSSRG